MSGFLTGLANIGTGFQQGQMNAATLQQKAQQIQAAQQAIDDQKRTLAAQAAAMNGLGGTGSAPPPPQGGNLPPVPQGPPPQQGPQPPPPGQSSAPAGTPQPQNGGVRMPGGMVSPPIQGPAPGGGNIGQMPPSGPQAAPQGAPPPGGMQQPQPGQGSGGGMMSPQDQMQLIAQVAQSIKQQSPGIDGPTLFEAVKMKLGLMQQVSAADKSDMMFMLQQLKGQQGMDKQGSEDDARAARLKQQDADRADLQKVKDSDAYQRAGLQAGAAMQRAQYVQGMVTDRFNSKQITGAQKSAMDGQTKAAVAQLNAAQRQISALVSAGTSADDPRFAALNRSIADATSKLDRVEKVAAGGGGPAGGQDSAGILAAAKDAIAKGAPRAAVIQRLQSQGINPAGL